VESRARGRHRGAVGDLPGRRRARKTLLPGLRDRRARGHALVRGRDGAPLARRGALRRRVGRVRRAARSGARTPSGRRRPAARPAARRAPARRPSHRGVAGRDPRPGRALERARGESQEGLPPHDARAGDGRRLAADPHRPDARDGAGRRVARRLLPGAPRGAGPVARRRAGPGPGADPARRPRAERLHVRDAGRRRDPHGPARGHRGGGRDPEGPAARGRQRGRAGDAPRDRRAGARRELRRVAPGGAGRPVQARARRPARARARVRPSRLQGGRRPRARPAAHGEVDGGGDGQDEALRGGGARLRRGPGRACR